MAETGRARWAEASLFGLTIVWGLSFVVVPWALASADSWTVTQLRATAGTAFLVAVRPRCFRATRLEWRAGILGGALLAAGYVLQTVGLETAGAGESGFLTAFYV